MHTSYLRPTLNAAKAALLLKGVVFGLLIVAGIMLWLTMKGNPLVVDHMAAGYAGYLMFGVAAIQLLELIVVKPIRAQKAFGAYKALSVATSVVAVVVLLTALVSNFATAIAIAFAAIVLTTIIDGLEALYL